MKSVTIYTDGACSGNPGPGGWGAILFYNDKKKEISGGEEKTTNNRMELMGAIVALETLKESCHVELYSDSKYLVDAFLQKWIFGWEKANWKRKGNKEVPNKELWKRLLVQYRRHEIVFNWVKGHADNEFNNRCDELAVAEWKKVKNQSAED